MKRILILGIAILLMACNNTSEKTNESTDSTVLKATDSTEIISSSDSSNSTNVNPAQLESKESKVQISKADVESPKVSENKEVAVVKAVENSDLPNIKNGELLISKSDCLACHKVQDKLLGPSYKDIANKYEKTKTNVEYLVKKVKAGGSGVWGAVPMSPHPTLSDDNARDMILYVLSLK